MPVFFRAVMFSLSFPFRFHELNSLDWTAGGGYVQTNEASSNVNIDCEIILQFCKEARLPR